MACNQWPRRPVAQPHGYGSGIVDDQGLSSLFPVAPSSSCGQHSRQHILHSPQTTGLPERAIGVDRQNTGVVCFGPEVHGDRHAHFSGRRFLYVDLQGSPGGGLEVVGLVWKTETGRAVRESLEDVQNEEDAVLCDP